MMFSPIISRYLFKEISNSFLGTLLILTLVIVGNSFVRLLSDASSGKLPVDVLMESVLFASAISLIKLVPIALLIGMMLAFSRLYRDSEMAAIRAAGISPIMLYRAIAWFIIPLTLALGLLVMFASPWLEGQYLSVKQTVNERPEAAGIPAGVFTTSNIQGGELTILAEDIDSNKSTMKRFFAHAQQGENETVIWGETAELFIDIDSGDRVLEIHNGERYEFKPQDDSMSYIQFEEHAMRIPLLENQYQAKLSSLPTSALWQSDNPNQQAELHWRLGIVLSAPLMALLALPLSHTTPRQGRYGKIALGVLIYAFYANALISGKSLLQKGSVPDWMGLWWVHILLLLLALWLLKKNFGSAS